MSSENIVITPPGTKLNTEENSSPINIPILCRHTPDTPAHSLVPNTPPCTPEPTSHLKKNTSAAGEVIDLLPITSPIPETSSVLPHEVTPPPLWLDEEFIETALRNQHPDLRVTNLNLSPAVETGENFVSLVYRADVGTNQGPFALIVKCLPEEECCEENVSSKREMCFYNETLPLLKKYAPEKMQLSIPLCYYTIHEGFKDAVVIQDLRPFGFRTVDRKFGLDLAHCKLALNELAKLHALSIALRMRDPDIFNEEIVKKFPECMYGETNRAYFEVFLYGCLTNVARTIREQFPLRFHEMSHVFDRLSTRAFQHVYDVITTPTLKQNSVLVLTHADFWSNNILFQYESKKNKSPNGCCMIDFQDSRCTSPVLDLIYFFYTSTNKALRAQHMKELLQMYYYKVHSVLRDVKSVTQPPPSSMFYASLEEMMREMKEAGVYALVTACFTMPIVVANPEDSPLRDDFTDARLHQFPFKNLHDGKIFKSRFLEILEDFDDEGFFKSF